MGKTVFILGAGASMECGCPGMMDFLDVADQLRSRDQLGNLYVDAFDTVFKARAELRSVHSKAQLDIHNIESVFGAFEMAKRFRKPFGDLDHNDIAKLSDAMKLLIVRTLELRTTFRKREQRGAPAIIAPHPYGDFADVIKTMRQKTPVTVITFNYDIGVDAALALSGQKVDYCLNKELIPGSDVPLIKLHGSINWKRCKHCNDEVVAWSFSDFIESYDSWKVYAAPFISSQRDILYLQIGSRLHAYTHGCGYPEPAPIPAIVPPTWEKGEHNHGFDNIWAHAAEQLAQAENIIVIGYSLPPTDQFFPILYALGTVSSTILKRFWLFDPDPEGSVEKRFRKMLGEAALQRFRPFKAKFSSALPDLEALAKEL